MEGCRWWRGGQASSLEDAPAHKLVDRSHPAGCDGGQEAETRESDRVGGEAGEQGRGQSVGEVVENGDDARVGSSVGAFAGGDGGGEEDAAEDGREDGDRGVEVER